MTTASALVVGLVLALFRQDPPPVDHAADAGPCVPLPLTTAEKSGFTRTSTSADVESLIDACVAASPKLTRLSLAKSTQGRDVPLVLIGTQRFADIAAARASGKPAVLVMANIHGGEVEGKEALQILLREFAAGGEGGHAELLEKLTIAFVPDFNPDGNDAIDRKNRPDQNGPIEGVGQRVNGQGLDLNRDYVKLEAPETRGLVAAVNVLDPLLVMDLHTTDGSFHGYDLTYAGVMHPATDDALTMQSKLALLQWMRAEMMGLDHPIPTFDYGDFDDNAHPEKGWSTFDCKPRYGTNYFGLTHRLTLLSEAYSHEPFEKRVRVTREFVLGALRYFADDETRMEVAHVVHFAQKYGTPELAQRKKSLPVRGELAGATNEEVLVGSCREEKDPVTGLTRVVDTDESHPVTMPVHVTFAGRGELPVPIAWAIPAATPEVETLLRRHGIACARLAEPRPAHAERFVIEKRDESPQPFQGHKLVTLAGHREASDSELPIGTLLVRSDQALARLAFVLLEPESDDGLATWGLIGAAADDPTRFAVLRVLPPTK